MILENKLLQALLVVLLFMVATMFIFKVTGNLPDHRVKITYSVGGAQRIYIVKSSSVSHTNSECISFTDDNGYRHTVCGTFETEIIK